MYFALSLRTRFAKMPPKSSSKVSKVKYSSAHIRNQSHVNESYLHWYKSHHNSVHGTFVGYHTEESDNEYLIEDERYYSRCLSMCDPYVNCYINTKRIRAFRHYIQDIFEETFGSLRWIDLPGGQHQVAIERNYLMNYIWLIGLMTNELDTTNNKDAGRQIRYVLEDLVFQAENVGIIVQKFFTPLMLLAQSHCYIEDTADILLTDKIPRPTVEKKIIRLQIKPDSTIFSGNKVDDFRKLLIYARKDCQTWSRFKTFPEQDKLDIVSKGMMEITENLKELQLSLVRPLKALRNAVFSQLRFLPFAPPTLTTYAKKMRKCVKTIMERNNFTLEDDDRKILESLLSEVVSHYQYVLRFGEMLVEEIWDIVLMARLSYVFIGSNRQNNITSASYEAVLMSRFKKSKLKKLLKMSKFKASNFYQVDCPDTLRKLPVVVSALNTEISLHLQGHKNATMSKVANPIHKFSTKRKTSLQRKESDEEIDGKDGGEKLLFVSPESDAL